MSKTREQFISELSSMQPALLIDWLVDMTEKSTNGEKSKKAVMPVISAICEEIKKRKPECKDLIAKFERIGDRLRGEKCCDMWDREAVEKIQCEGYQICTEILALF